MKNLLALLLLLTFTLSCSKSNDDDATPTNNSNTENIVAHPSSPDQDTSSEDSTTTDGSSETPDNTDSNGSNDDTSDDSNDNQDNDDTTGDTDNTDDDTQDDNNNDNPSMSSKSVCDRSSKIEKYLVKKVSELIGNEVKCEDINDQDLALITEINLSGALAPKCAILNPTNCLRLKTVLKNNDFSGLVNVIKLDLSNNKISIIHTGAFNGLENLEFLKLSDNKIKAKKFMGKASMRRNIFEPLINLKTLEIDGNKQTYMTRHWTGINDTAYVYGMIVKEDSEE